MKSFSLMNSMVPLIAFKGRALSVYTLSAAPAIRIRPLLIRDPSSVARKRRSFLLPPPQLSDQQPMTRKTMKYKFHVDEVFKGVSTCCYFLFLLPIDNNFLAYFHISDVGISQPNKTINNYIYIRINISTRYEVINTCIFKRSFNWFTKNSTNIGLPNFLMNIQISLELIFCKFIFFLFFLRKCGWNRNWMRSRITCLFFIKLSTKIHLCVEEQ